MSLSDQENYEQPAKRRKKNTTRPFAVSQQMSMTGGKQSKRTSSLEVDSSTPKKAKTQPNQFAVYDEDSTSNASSAGVIQSVKLINFMCHSHFEIAFNPRINFISGCNGSGKSAIQTAIVVGLGGVAAKTNRSSKIDGLIKHGCNSGTIIINLLNTGDNAYKPREYGNMIQITRHITSSSASYKIQNQWGKLMSSTKKELESILMRFRIQPNNPVAILNQDTARNFLTTTKAEAKYALFRKATLLDEADDLLGEIADEVVEQETRAESKKRAITQVQEELDKMSKKMKLVENLRLSKTKKFTLENELAWSKVNGCRNEVKQLEEIRVKQNTVTDELQVELDKWQTEEKKLDSEKKQFEADIANMQEECKTKEEDRQRLTTEFRNLKKLYEDKCVTCDEVEMKLKSRRKDRIELKRGLDDTQRMELEQKQKKEEATLQRSKLKEALDVNESKMSVLDGEMSRIKTTAEHFHEKIAYHSRRIKEARDQIGILERQIQKSGQNDDNLSMYEPWMPTLLKEIDEAVRKKKFSKAPRGPLGRYIKVKDEKWIYAIESNLSCSFLSSFLVNNGKDRQLIYSIMNQVIRSGHKPTVHCSTFQEQDRSDMLPRLETKSRGYSNIMRALSISDTVVSNFLMDSRNVHRTLLVEEDNDCINFVKEDGNMPRNCSLILNLGADQYLSGFRSYGNQDRSRRTRILRKSAADHLRELREEVAEKQEFITKINQEIESSRSKLNECTDQIRKISREIDSVRTEVVEFKYQIKNLTAIIEMETPSLQMKLDEIRELEQEIEKLEERIKVLITERTEAQTKMVEAKKRMSIVDQKDFFAQQQQLNVDKEKVTKKLYSVNAKISELRNRISEQNKKVETLEARLRDTQEKLDTEEYTASQLTDEELATERSTQEIQQELKEIESFISEAQKKLGTEANLLEKDYLDKKEKLCGYVGTFKELMNLSLHFKQMYNSRKSWVGKLRDINASIIMAQFQTVLQSRNYKGTLKFDHAARKLDILMAPIDGGDTLMNTSSLSGGEKSYSTVAFLLALWSNMELPFYSMDEYDVFMDAINRKTITKLLMAFAERKDNRQFIFLTPLDVSIIRPGDNVNVHRVNKIQT